MKQIHLKLKKKIKDFFVPHKIDRQFLFFLLQNVFVGICGMVDTGFGNHIDIDSVCVLSAYIVITWMDCSYCIGAYAYRVMLDKAKVCFLIQIFAGIFLGILFYCLNGTLPYLFSLTDNQYVLFTDCLKIHAISCPIFAIREFLGNYVEYTCRNKQAFTGNLIFYSAMIITDAIVIFAGGDLRGLLWCTLFCSVIYSIYELFTSSILKETFVFDIRECCELLKHGLNTWIDRITGKIATIVFNIYASRLGTSLYSIHAVCYALGVFTENFTNALYTYETVALSKKSASLKNKFAYCFRLTKKYAGFLLLFGYGIAYLLLLFTHGKVPILDCVLYTGLYCTEIITLLFHEPMRAYLTSEHQTKYLRYGGVFGILVRIPIVLVGYYLTHSLILFAVASAVDFGMRGLYFYICSIRYIKKQGDSNSRIAVPVMGEPV